MGRVQGSGFRVQVQANCNSGRVPKAAMAVVARRGKTPIEKDFRCRRRDAIRSRRSLTAVSRQPYAVIPLVSSINAVSRFSSSSRNNVSLNPLVTSMRRQVPVVGHAILERHVQQAVARLDLSTLGMIGQQLCRSIQLAATPIHRITCRRTCFITSSTRHSPTARRAR